MNSKFKIFILIFFFITSSFVYANKDAYKSHGSGILLSQSMSKADYDMLVKYGIKGLEGQGYNTTATAYSDDEYEEQEPATSVEVHYSKPKIKKSRAKRLPKKQGMSFSGMALKFNKN